MSRDRIVLVHLSDLHMAEDVLTERVAIFAGYRTHHVKLCKALYTAIPEIKVATNLAEDEELHFVVTGDLTSTGRLSEFTAAYSFLHHRFPDDWDYAIDSTGLGLAFSSVSQVPGNHDHWLGTWVYPQTAYSRNLFPRYFRTTPWPALLSSRHGLLELELYGVDSNSGMGRIVNRNPSAGGSISPDELKALRSSLKVAGQRRSGPNVRLTVRVILCHHTLKYDGGVAHPLSQPSTDELLQLAANSGVAAILTGHSHGADHENHRVPGQPGRRVWEFRSPTTTQGPAKRNGMAPGFWVHEILVDDNPPRAEWWPRLFLFNAGRFVRTQDPWFKVDLH